MQVNRRTALAAGAAAACAGWLRPGRAEERERPDGADARPGGGDRLGPLCVFAKHLQWLSPADLADVLVEMDVDGIEATVRGGGQVEPADVDEGLPRLVEALAARDRRVVMMTTGINAVDSPHAESVLERGAELGIPLFRMGYYRYELDRPILPQLEEFTRRAERLAELCRALGLTALYQNHAGDRYVGAPLWDLRQMLSGIGDGIAAAYDVRHATVEGGLSWPIDWAVIRPHVGAIYLKDFEWTERGVQNVPFGTGRVSRRLLESLAEVPRRVPVSLHMEYLDHRRPELIDACVAAYREDRQAVRRLVGI